ncbi:uncharacterized protein YMR317W-like isoform X1 [Hyposmocoma kahamanoa]|uniref:uncharacterized protein YMR317W-like isoform X1 n=1 Tax=Hyposmocoma kahamanoa TaxID=1477025 RepID=UPI000E6D9A9B|nr:uncharacterized protein YMR317W-like isoform X1 [Hyposmocoma kahamanoa]
MRKTSFDGGDIASITSGFDNDSKKPLAGILKTKRNSIKKKVQNFSLDSDDGVIEPLLQKVKENTETGNQSAKNLLSKTKNDSIIEKGDDKEKLLADKKSGMPSMTNIPSITNNAYLVNGSHNVKVSIKSNGSSTMPMHSHGNTSMFNNDALQGTYPPKTQILVGIESTKLSNYSPSPLIFTTAKIHTDGKSKQMEPVHVTPVPILSTIEANVIKTGSVIDYTTDINETLRRDNEQNMQNNIFSKNPVGSVPFPRVTSNTSSDAVTKKSSGNKVIITCATLIQVSQAPKVSDVKATDVKSAPVTSTINITQSTLLKSEQSTRTSAKHIQDNAKSTALNENPKSALEKITPLMYNIKTDYSILTPITSSVHGINKSDNMIHKKVLEMDINKNIQSPKTITSPVAGTSNLIDSSSSIKYIPDSSGTGRFTRQVSCSLKDNKIQSKKYETAERCFEPDNKLTASNPNKTNKTSSSKVNSDRNLASNGLNLQQLTAKSITSSITTAASSVISSISSSESPQAQIVATLSKAIAITKDSPVSVVKSLTTNDIINSTSNVVKMTTNADTHVSNSEQTQSAAITYTTISASAVSKSLTVSTVKTPAMITTSQSAATAKNIKISVAKPLITSSLVAEAMSVKMTTTAANSTLSSIVKSQPEADTKSTCSVFPALSKPSSIATAKTPIITPQSITTVSQTSSKSTTTSAKSTTAPRMPQNSTAKNVVGDAIPTATKPSTVTTMKSSAGQKVNTSKLATPKSSAAVVSTGSTTKKVSNEQNGKKTSDGFSEEGKGSKT